MQWLHNNNVVSSQGLRGLPRRDVLHGKVLNCVVPVHADYEKARPHAQSKQGLLLWWFRVSSEEVRVRVARSSRRGGGQGEGEGGVDEGPRHDFCCISWSGIILLAKQSQLRDCHNLGTSVFPTRDLRARYGRSLSSLSAL